MIQEKEELFQLANKHKIAIKVAKNVEDNKLKGVHILNPTFRELEEALGRAMGKEYDLVVIHNYSTWVDKRSKNGQHYKKAQ